MDKERFEKYDKRRRRKEALKKKLKKENDKKMIKHIIHKDYWDKFVHSSKRTINRMANPYARNDFDSKKSAFYISKRKDLRIMRQKRADDRRDRKIMYLEALYKFKGKSNPKEECDLFLSVNPLYYI